MVSVHKTEFSTRVEFGQGQAFPQVLKVEESPLYVTQKSIIIIDGPQPLKAEEVEAKGYSQFIRVENTVQLVGTGYRSIISC